MTAANHLVLLAIAWAVYGLIHSGLACPASKTWFRRRFPSRFRAYRLLFNLIAGLLLVPPLWLLFSYPGPALWQWPPVAGWIADAAALAALAGFLWSMKIYDSGEFLGLRQLRQAALEPDRPAPLRLSPAHRLVRHPWYFFGLVILWTREMNAALLVTALILTLYIVVGSRREETDLIARYGEQYREYRRRVPSLIPLPWRYLNARQAQEILNMADKH
jgi:protein-S-isoprenylcysteine O-methyltransferase Ste14